MSRELDPCNGGLLPLIPALGMYVLPIVPTVGATPKDAALREQCVVELIGMTYLREPI